MAKKDQKTLYLPLWVIEILTKESERYGGPGVVAAACIVHFASLKPGQKINVLKHYREVEIEAAYEDEFAAGPLLEEPERRKSKHKRAKP